MTTIYLVVAVRSHTSGHGEQDTSLELVSTGQWDEHLCPAYTTRAEAERQREILSGHGLKVVELVLLERAAP